MGHLCGWGVNDATYNVSSRSAPCCPIYRVWASMVTRVKNPAKQLISPAYVGTDICEEWRSFMSFRAWMIEQEWEGNHLDKDILEPGCRIYSPQTCAFVPAYVNLLTTGCTRKLNNPIGVTFEPESSKLRPFRAKVSTGRKGVTRRLGHFETALEAHSAWQIAKAQVAEDALVRFGRESCFRTDVAEAISSRIWSLHLDRSIGRETTFL